jgi:site-specific DNA recombinase
VETSNASVVRAFEKKVAKLELEKARADEKLAISGKPKHTFEESYEHSLRFLASPWNIWINADLLGRRTGLRLAFSEPLPYCRKEGLRTPNFPSRSRH